MPINFSKKKRAISSTVIYTLSALATLTIVVTGIAKQHHYLCTQYNSPESARFYNNDGPCAKEGYIAHGGGIHEYLYTNSREAVIDSLNRGFQFVELDLIETDDGHILAAHDRDYFYKITGLPHNSRIDSNTVNNLKIDGKYSILLGDDIYALMLEHPEMILVTDKITNYDLLIREIPLPDRMILECFSTSDVIEAKKRGFPHAAYSIFSESQLDIAIETGLKLLIISSDFAFSSPRIIDKLRNMHNSGAVLMVYGNACNSPSTIHQHLGRTFSKFYVDNCSPTSIPPASEVNHAN